MARPLEREAAALTPQRAHLEQGETDSSGASLADPAPYRTVMWLTPVALTAGGFAMLAAKPVPRAVHLEASSRTGRSPVAVFILLGGVTFLFSAGEGTLRAFFNVYLDTRLAVPATQIGATMGLAQLLPVAAALTVPGLLARFGTAGALTLASIVAACALVALGAVPWLPVAGVAYMAAMSVVAVHGATLECFQPAISCRAVAHDHRGDPHCRHGTGLGEFSGCRGSVCGSCRLPRPLFSNQRTGRGGGDRDLGLPAAAPGAGQHRAAMVESSGLKEA